MYIRLQLHRWKIAKKLFIIEIEGGNDGYIPVELSLKKFPMSFKYYDPIIVIIKNMMPQVRKQYYGLKNALQLYFGNDTLLNSLKRKIGIQPDIKNIIGEDLTKEQLSFKHK